MNTKNSRFRTGCGKTGWIIRDGKTQLVEITETSLGQFGDRGAAIGGPAGRFRSGTMPM